MGKQGAKPNTKVVRSKPLGRPSSFNQDTANQLCFYLSMGESLRKATAHEGMPSIQTVFSWFTKYPQFLEQYTRAKQEAADAMAEEIMDISDNSEGDTITDENGRIIPNSARIQRDRLRVETRKWLMAKMKPKVYGEKVDVTSDGKELPAPILNVLVQNNTKDEIQREVIDGEVSENTASDQNVQNRNLIDELIG